MKITLIHPSRSRADKALKAFDEWKSKAKYKDNIEYLLSIDSDDPSLNEYINLFTNKARIIIGINNFVVQATNRAAKLATGDILIYVSDDFGCPQNWDDEIIKTVTGKDIFAVEVDDCYQTNRNLLTIPIISKSLYEANGYFFHPEFKSMFCDNWIFEEAKRKYNCLVEARHLKFEHRHYSLGKAAHDDVYKRSEAHYQEGKKIFNKLATEHKWNIKY